VGALIDTGVFVTAERTGRDPRAVLDSLGLDRAEPSAIASITAAELLAGVELPV
jgi:hypothetical protein